MNNIFDLAEQCLITSDLESKLEITRKARDLRQADGLTFSDPKPPLPIEQVRWPPCLQFVPPKDLPRRSLNAKTGRIALLHAVAHIEFSAILLHWDGLYRFRGLPKEYYHDWLRVTLEELGHFEMLRRRLSELGSDYGELPVHDGLWRVADDTAHDVLARLALVPRCMEARGLDVTPGMIERLEQAGDRDSVKILRKILADEVGHVALGSKWFHRICRNRKLSPEPIYFDLLEQYFQGGLRGPFNRTLRLQAGFSQEEMDRLQAQNKQ